MPDINKAILDPFTPLSVPEALMVAVCGIVVVFMMLAILALVIIIIRPCQEGRSRSCSQAGSSRCSRGG